MTKKKATPPRRKGRTAAPSDPLGMLTTLQALQPKPAVALDYERLACVQCGQHRDANVHLEQHRYSNYHEYQKPVPIVAGKRKGPKRAPYTPTYKPTPAFSNVGAYFEAALEIDLDPNNPLVGCPLVSVCGIACREAIDAGRILTKSLRATLGEGSEHEAAVCNTVLRLCQVIYCG